MNYQTLPRGTSTFVISGDYNVLSVTEIVVNNFTRYSHC